MFHDSQIESYKRITAPATLRERTLTACETVSPARPPAFSKVFYGLAPLAACILLLFLVLPRNNTGNELLLQAGDLKLSTQSSVLPFPEDTACTPRMASTRAPQYTIILTGNQTMDILSADGHAILDENGDVVWTVEIPATDTDFGLYLETGETTYYVPLTYHAQDGSFSIRYETK